VDPRGQRRRRCGWVAVVAHAGVSLVGPSLRAARPAVYLVLAAAGTLTVGPYVVLVLLGCGLAELAIRRTGSLASVSPAGLVLAATGVAALPALCWTALKVGALSYGGGFVIIPLMQSDAVDANGWMTQQEFLNALSPSVRSRPVPSCRPSVPSATRPPGSAAGC